MRGHGIPNDLMQNFDPISIIFFVPLLDRLVYPAMRKAKIPFPPINRITLGFWVGALAMAYAAIIQHYIYISGPCYQSPLCDASIVNGVAQGNVSATTFCTSPPLALSKVGEFERAVLTCMQRTFILPPKPAPTCSSASAKSSPR
jgi:dipeptide/tripeptide permease